MDKFEQKESLIRRRINQNLLKVKNESHEVKALLSLGVQTSKPRRDKYGVTTFYDIYKDLNLCASCTSRKDLLRVCILLATSRNTIAQENIIDVVSIKLGKIKDKDYKYIADLIHLKDARIVEHINDFLCYYLDGFADLHKKYYKQFYNIEKTPLN